MPQRTLVKHKTSPPRSPQTTTLVRYDDLFLSNHSYFHASCNMQYEEVRNIANQPQPTPTISTQSSKQNQQITTQHQ